MIYTFVLYFILFFNFTILYWFCHISTSIRHRYTHVPHPESSSLFPPCTIPLGRPRAPAPSIQYHALNLFILDIDVLSFHSLCFLISLIRNLQISSFFFKKTNLFIYFCLALLGLPCCTDFFFLVAVTRD